MKSIKLFFVLALISIRSTALCQDLLTGNWEVDQFNVSVSEKGNTDDRDELISVFVKGAGLDFQSADRLIYWSLEERVEQFFKIDGDSIFFYDLGELHDSTPRPSLVASYTLQNEVLSLSYNENGLNINLSLNRIK